MKPCKVTLGVPGGDPEPAGSGLEEDTMEWVVVFWGICNHIPCNIRVGDAEYTDPAACVVVIDKMNMVPGHHPAYLCRQKKDTEAGPGE